MPFKYLSGNQGPWLIIPYSYGESKTHFTASRNERVLPCAYVENSHLPKLGCNYGILQFRPLLALPRGSDRVRAVTCLELAFAAPSILNLAQDIFCTCVDRCIFSSRKDLEGAYRNRAARPRGQCRLRAETDVTTFSNACLELCDRCVILIQFRA